MTAEGTPDGVAGGARRWTFGAVQFDERTFELQVGGQPTALERKSLEVLRQLLYRAGEVVTKDELLEAVWPGRVLSDNSLPKSISRIREVIGDADQAVIKTVHGYGYRLVAPVKVEHTRAAPALTRLDLKAGDHPPLRPLWSLVERLGAGGQGEVWLVRHDKTGEQRVFKFALDLGGLAAIKREITLNRFLRETLAGRDEFTRVLDWNLEELPYYVELEYGGAGNLEDWAAAQGGLGRVAPADRLEIVARIADALAAAHSVGVLHKDLKPANILVTPGSGVPGIKLADFGSGGVLDPQRLEALGITRLGFTQSILQGEAAATAMYLAPEVMAGQPATVRADVYALGILLYQFVIGDLKQPLAPGWEQRVAEPLLAEDIALAVAGDPMQRLADAAVLAARLRGLEERRRQREAELAEKQRIAEEQRAAEARARSAELAVERLRARRRWMTGTLAVLIVASGLSLSLFLEARRARNEAAAAAASSQAVADYLANDLFAQVGSKPLRDFTVAELIESAAASLDRRNEDLPQVSAQLHAALGRAAFATERYALAERQLGEALTSFESSGMAASPAHVDVAAQLLNAQKSRISELPAVLPRYERLLEAARDKLGARHPSVLSLREQVAKARFWAGDWKQAAEELAALIAELQRGGQPGRTIGVLQSLRSRTLQLLGHYVAARHAAADALQRLQADPNSLPAEITDARLNLASALAVAGQIADARAHQALATEFVRSWYGDDPASGGMVSVRHGQAFIELQDDNPRAAATQLESVIRQTAQAEWNKIFDVSAVYRSDLVEAYARSGRRDAATKEARVALAIAGSTFGERYPTTQRIRVQLADLLRETDPTEAARILAAVDPAVVARLGPDALLAAEWRRVEGLLKLQRGEREAARADLQEALRVFAYCYGVDHAITRNARSELARIPVL